MNKGLPGLIGLMIVILLVSSGCNSISATHSPSPTELQIMTIPASPTEASLPTDTPLPTNTPSPTVTNQPTGTPSPSITRSPTDTPSPTVISPPTEAPVVVIVSSIPRTVDGMSMVYVPEGEFLMGSDVGALNERPRHSVFLDAYWIDKTEVTNAMFARFVQATGFQTDAEWRGVAWVFDGVGWSTVSGADWLHPQGNDSNLTGLENHPVVNVSWNDAAAYCGWVEARLPSEAEWEKAAIGTDGRTYPWGEQNPDGDLLNFADVNLNVDWADKTANDGYKFTAPVGSYPAGISIFRALDMAGNVWEWVNDWYQETYYTTAPNSNPAGPSSGEGRVLRGGSWNHSGQDIRSSIRIWANPSDAIDNFGFRCSRSIP